MISNYNFINVSEDLAENTNLNLDELLNLINVFELSRSVIGQMIYNHKHEENRIMNLFLSINQHGGPTSGKLSTL